MPEADLPPFPSGFQVSLTIPGHPEFLGLVRLAVAGLCHRLGLDLGEAEDLKLAVTEACSQALQANQVPERIALAFQVEPDRIQVDILPEPGDGSAFAPGGPAALGLVLLEALVDATERLHSPHGLRLTRMLPLEAP